MRKQVLFAVAMVFLCGCAANVIHHSEQSAAQSAVQFVKQAFVQRDISGSYLLLSENFRAHYSAEQYNRLVIQLHPSSYPSWVAAEEFEPLAGQQAMNVFLHGANGEEEFFYRFAMEGTAETGYKVAGVFRGNGPYPSSQLRRKLEARYSSEDARSAR